MRKIEKYNFIKILTITLTYVLSISCGGVDTDDFIPAFPEELEDLEEDSAIVTFDKDLDIVLGDVVQAQVLNSLSTTVEVDDVLLDFKAQDVQAIRIAIFTTGENPNEEIYDYLYIKAKAEGFKILTSPSNIE